jgi:hypothetical protein
MASPPDVPPVPSLGHLAAQLLANAFEGCEVAGCKHKSFGAVCSECSRFVCQSHYYVAPIAQMPPKVVCTRCILARAHREPVLEADFVEPGPAKVRVVGIK